MMKKRYYPFYNNTIDFGISQSETSNIEDEDDSLFYETFGQAKKQLIKIVEEKIKLGKSILKNVKELKKGDIKKI